METLFFSVASDINDIIGSKLYQDKPREKGSIQTFKTLRNLRVA